MPARSTSKELRQHYRQTGKYVRYGSQDHFIKNYSLAPASTTTGSGYKWVTTAAIDYYSDSGSNSSDSGDSGGGPTLDPVFNRI
jgi:hypothetical protein